MSPFATLVAIKGSGTVTAVDARGSTRVLHVGDALQKGESVRTTDDVTVQLLMTDGSLLMIVPAQNVRIDEQMLDPQPPSAGTQAMGTTPAAIQAVIRAIESGGDLSEALDEAAAGLSAAAGGNDGGHSFVRLLRIAEGVEPLDYEFTYRAPTDVEARHDPTSTAQGPDVSLLAAPSGALTPATLPPQPQPQPQPHQEPPPGPQDPQQPPPSADDRPHASLAASQSLLIDESTDLNTGRTASIVIVTTDVGRDAPVAGVHMELIIDRAETGLQTTGGSPITMVRGSTQSNVIGMYDSDGDGIADSVAFTITLAADGGLTVIQAVSLSHFDTGNVNEASSLAGSLSVRLTVEDADGDTATATHSIGDRILFADDGPALDLGLAAIASWPSITTTDAQSAGAGAPQVSASLEQLFSIAANPGADADGHTLFVSYAMSIGQGAAVSGLTSGGLAVTLAMDGADVVGNTSVGAVFRLSVDASGTVSLTQYAAVDHLPEDLDASNDTDFVQLPIGSIVLSARAVLTDGDGDTVRDSQSVDISSAIGFRDDVPSVSVGAVADAAIVLATQDSQTIGVASDTASASFAAAFAAAVSASAGADAPAATTTLGGYTLAVLDAASGLTSGGLAVTLAMDGADVVGSTSAGAVFRISVDASGTVSLTQYAAVDHLPEDLDASNDTSSVTLASGLITLSATATTSDFDHDSASATVSADLGDNIRFDDDVPSVIHPDTAYVVNVAGTVGSVAHVPLDSDGTVVDNTGADAAATLRFLETDGSASGFSTNSQAIYQYVSADGTVLIGSTLAGSTYDSAWADRASSGAFVVTLNASPDSASYDFTLLRQIDGALGSFNTQEGAWSYEGGNTNYVYYRDMSGQGLPDVLLTPSAGATRINGTANESGASGGGGGQNVGEGEAIRVDFVTHVGGHPTATNYVSSASHTFDEHVLVNGASVTFTLSAATAATGVNFRAHDDADWSDAVPGEDNAVGDYAAETTTLFEQITKVVVNGIAYAADAAAGGLMVDFLADGSVTITGLRNSDTVAIFTEDGFTTVEYMYASGSSFALGGYGASRFEPGALVTLGFDLGLVDGDNDMIRITDGLQVHLSPDDHVIQMGDSSDNVLIAAIAQPSTLVGLGGNDVLIGGTGDDILVGGSGDDLLQGGAGMDTGVFADASGAVLVDLAAGTASGDGSDILDSVENAIGSGAGDTLLGNAGRNELQGGGGNDLLDGRDGADLLVGGSGRDVLVGGTGSDVLVGGSDGNLPDSESDVFVWHLADQGTPTAPAADQIKDFSFGAGGDVLDLRDLIQGETSGIDLAAAQSLDAFLHFTEVNGQAVLQIDPDGGPFSPTETITFGNMSLAQLGASLGLGTGSNDLQIIQQMLEQGNLKNNA